MIEVYFTIRPYVVVVWTVSIEPLNVWPPSHVKRSVGEICTSWQTWSEYLNVTSILGQSLLHSLIYIALAVRVIRLPLSPNPDLVRRSFSAGVRRSS